MSTAKPRPILTDDTELANFSMDVIRNIEEMQSEIENLKQEVSSLKTEIANLRGA